MVATKKEKLPITPPTQTRANVRQSVVSRSSKFGIGRKYVGIKALFCVGGEPLWLIEIRIVQAESDLETERVFN